jgi:AraC-like DNA-binding protein
LHVGLSAEDYAGPLAARYEQALGAAEHAFSRRLPVATSESTSPRDALPIQQARRALDVFYERSPEAMSTRFEHYIETVAMHCGYRVELGRAHLAAGFDQAAQAVVATGTLPDKAYTDMCDGLARAERHAGSMSELSVAYRRAITDLMAMAEHPVLAGQDRSLQRALTFIRAHLSEPLRLGRVAKIAGFSANYFSQLFKKRERMTFERYVRQLRIERAKQLLSTTDLSTERISLLSGFPVREYFHRVFKQAVGTTPAEYRASLPTRRHRARRGHGDERSLRADMPMFPILSPKLQ